LREVIANACLVDLDDLRARGRVLLVHLWSSVWFGSVLATVRLPGRIEDHQLRAQCAQGTVRHPLAGNYARAWTRRVFDAGGNLRARQGFVEKPVTIDTAHPQQVLAPRSSSLLPFRL